MLHREHVARIYDAFFIKFPQNYYEHRESSLHQRKLNSLQNINIEHRICTLKHLIFDSL